MTQIVAEREAVATGLWGLGGFKISDHGAWYVVLWALYLAMGGCV